MSQIKSYIGIAKDHSSSMSGIAKAALKDYNSKINSIKAATVANSQDTILSVVEFASSVRRKIINSNILSVKEDTSYVANGMTVLFDAVGDLIEQFESVPDAADPNVSFLLFIVTDGAENNSRRWNATKLAAKIRTLTNTDRWTFVFRVPRGYSDTISRSLGIPPGNIQEWDQNDRGVETASQHDAVAFDQYFAARRSQIKSTDKFYTNLSKVTVEDVKATLVDISSKVAILRSGDVAEEIRSFVSSKIGSYIIGAAYYQLTKTETVQPQKKIMVRNKNSREIYSGYSARQLLGLPDYGSIKVTPGNHGEWDIFVQSTSVNRKIMPNTELIYWTGN